MGDYVAFEAPAWLWILSCLALLAAGIAFGALAAYALRRAESHKDTAVPRGQRRREDLAAIHARLAKLEAPAPAPARLDEPPDTIEDSGARPCILPALWPRDEEITTTLVS